MAQEQKIMLPPDVNTQQLMMILNHVYPVGSYYETSDKDFDPNDSFVGEWSLEESGRVHVSAGAGYNIGKKGGEATHTLTEAELPNHRHTFTTDSAGDHTHSLNHVLGNSGGDWTGDTAGNLSGSGRKFGYINPDYTIRTVTYTGSGGAHTHTGTTNGAGGTQPHNNMPPYITVNRWHRNK